MDITRISAVQSDERGEIIDIIKRENVEYVTIIHSRVGAVRGNHFHKGTFQFLYVMSGRLRAFSQMPGQEMETADLLTGDLILNVPEEHHAFEALEDSSFLVMTRGPRGGDDYENDTYRLEVPLRQVGQ